MAEDKHNRLHGRLWITSGDDNFAGEGRVTLLRHIRSEGSITKAAKRMGMSYKCAWDNLEAMNSLAESPLVEKASGGSHGGGTVLTKAGEDFVNLYDKYMDVFSKVLQFMEENPGMGNMINKLTFASSADNSFFGTVKSIERGAVSAIVQVDAGNGITITASVSNASVNRMGLVVGANVCALINSNQLIVMKTDDSVVTSARNKFTGTVKVVTKGAVNSDIAIDLSNNVTLNVIITNESAEKMALAYGMSVTAMCKATAVMLVA